MTTPCVGILIIQGSKVLLVRNGNASGYNDNAYGLPAGRLNDGENDVQAAVRELREETGLVTTESSLIDFPNNVYVSRLENRTLKKERLIEYSWRVFLCTQFDGALHSSDETVPEWIDIGKLDQVKLILNVQEAITTGLLHIKNS